MWDHHKWCVDISLESSSKFGHAAKQVSQSVAPGTAMCRCSVALTPSLFLPALSLPSGDTFPAILDGCNAHVSNAGTEVRHSSTVQGSLAGVTFQRYTAGQTCGFNHAGHLITHSNYTCLRFAIVSAQDTTRLRLMCGLCTGLLTLQSHLFAFSPCPPMLLWLLRFGHWPP